MPRSFQDELNLKIDAGHPVIQIISYEWRRILGFTVTSIKREKAKRALYWWNKATGIMVWDNIDKTLKRYVEESDNKDSKASKDIASLALKWYREVMPENSILVMEDLHLFLNTQKELLVDEIRECARLNPQKKKTLILASPLPDLPPELEKDVYVMEIPLPGKNTLKKVIEEVEKEFKEDKQEFTVVSGEVDQIAEAALGLTEIEAKHTFKEIGIEKKQLSKAEIPLIIDQKEQIIRKSGTLEYIHPNTTMDDVGGMEKLKIWLNEQKRAFEPGAQKFGINAPKGVLFLGIPGCGKSWMAKAIGKAWDVPLLKFDVGAVYGKYVGESEHNIRKALNIADAIAPCVLWIDEIEKGIAGSKSSNELDAGVSARVFGSLLTWMQDKEKPVFVVATANDISKLPPEFLRKGRFNEIFFVDLPGPQSRNAIWHIHLSRRIKGRLKDAKIDFNRLVNESCFYSGSEIEEAVNSGLLRAYNDDHDREVTTEDLIQSKEQIFPLSKTMPKEIMLLRQWADVRVRAASDEHPEDFEQKIIDAEKIPKLKSERMSSPFIEDNVKS